MVVELLVLHWPGAVAARLPRRDGVPSRWRSLETALLRHGLADHDRLTGAVAKGYCAMGWRTGLRIRAQLGFLLCGCAAAAALAAPAARAQGGGDSAAHAAATRVPAAGDTTPPAALRPMTSGYDTTRTDSTVQYAAVMGIDEVVEATLRNSPAIAQANGAVRTGQSGERVAYGELLPGLTLNSGIFQTNQRALVLTGPVNQGGTAFSYPAQAYSLGLAASFDVFFEKQANEWKISAEEAMRVRSVVDAAIEDVAPNANGPVELSLASDSFDVMVTLRYPGNLPPLPDLSPKKVMVEEQSFVSGLSGYLSGLHADRIERSAKGEDCEIRLVFRL